MIKERETDSNGECENDDNDDEKNDSRLVLSLLELGLFGAGDRA